MRTATHRKNFTLIELLVVIAIIALLASMLFPALNLARETAKAIACTNIEHQLGQANLLYANDYNGYLPICANGSWNWQGNSDYWNLAGAKANNKGGTSHYYWSLSAICPKAQAAFNDSFQENGMTYYNVARSYGHSVQDYFVPFRIDKVTKPAGKICLADAVSWDISLSGSYYPDNYAQCGESYKASAVAYRHPGLSANLVFFDGHGERQAWRHVYANRWLLFNPLL